MSTKNKKRIIQTANRFGMSMAAMATQGPPIRRSIPVKEVNEMIEREVARVKSERTIYDDRNDLLQRKTLIELISEVKAELNKTSIAIKRELDLDSLR